MGTRSITAVVLDGEIRVAQYGQSDGYPAGQGQVIVEFLLQAMKRPLFDEQVRKCSFLSYEDVRKRYIEVGAKSFGDDGSLGLDLLADKELFLRYPELSREIGGAILELVQNGKPQWKNPGGEHLPVTELENEIDFVRAGLFCEFAYVVDLDNDVLEVYTGFHKDDVPKGERFAHLERLKQGGKPDEYSPVHLCRKYPFSELTPETMEQLQKELFDSDE